MTKFELYDWYLENRTKNEIPLNFEEWEREIYPKDMAFLKQIEQGENI